MSYWLGIDLGTTFTAAAICREEGRRRALPEMIPLGTRSTAVSSVVYLAPDGQVMIGEAAERRAVTDPERVVRQFKRRIGDEVPMVVGGLPHSAPEIAAMVLHWVIDRVAQREGGTAAGIVITHPASWGTYKIQTMTRALHAAGLPEIAFRAEPEAAAASYALQERIELGSTIAVYDLGGGTFDAAVVRKTGAATFSVLGHPQGLDHLGGADFDDAVLNHVRAAVPALAQLDPTDPTTLAATAALRRECTEAKEALSADTEVTIPVLAPGIHSQVRLVRAEFEDMIRPYVTRTIEALHEALRSAELTAHDLDVVLLVGGSSRVPLVAQLVSAELGRPVAVDADPKAAIALGAALSALPTDIAAADLACDPPVQGDAVGEPPTESTVAGFTQMQTPQRPSLTAIPLDVDAAQLHGRRARSRRVKQLALAGVLALLTLAGVASVPLLTSRGGPSPQADAGTPAPNSPLAPSGPLAPRAPASDVASPAPDARKSSDESPPRGSSGGPVRMTPPTVGNKPVSGAAKPDPATGPTGVPAPPRAPVSPGAPAGRFPLLRIAPHRSRPRRRIPSPRPRPPPSPRLPIPPGAPAPRDGRPDGHDRRAQPTPGAAHVNQATGDCKINGARPRLMREDSATSLAGMAPAQALYDAVCADPSARLTVGVVGPGGCGKSALLAALRQAYLAAGITVVGIETPAVGLTPTVGLAPSGNVAVLVDDAHQLAGPDLDRLRRVALTSDARLVVAYRPWPRKPELAKLEDALGAHLPPVLLDRLDRRAIQIRCAARLGGALPSALVDLLCAQTGGVPRLIDRVVDVLRAAGTLTGDCPELPPEVVEHVRHDLDRIAPQLRALLLAVGLGAAPDPDILADVLALELAVVTDLLSMAHSSGLLLDVSPGEGARVIPLVRQALVAGTAPGARRVVQRLVLAAHLDRGRPALDVAHQLLEAGARGSDLAAVFAAAADAALAEPAGSARAVSDRAALAVQLYAKAVTAGADAASLAPGRAQASALVGDLDQALRLADQALSDPSCSDLARAGNVAAVVLAQRGLLARSAEVYRWVGTARMGSAAPLAALALLATGSLAQAREVLAASVGDRPPTLVAGAESLMATGVLESVLGSPTVALSTLTQAAALLEPGGPAVLLPDTPAALAAIVALHSGELDVAVSVLERALACGAGGLFARARYQLLLAWTAMIRGDPALARGWLARTVPESGTREPRDELFAAALTVGLARRGSDIPALQAAWAAAREAIVRHPADLFALLPLGELAVAAARLGDFDRVAPHLQQARTLLERLGDPPLWAAPLHWYGLHAAILREQPSAAEPHAAALMKAARSHHYAAVLAVAGRAWMRVLAGQFDPSEVESAARGLQSIGLANDGSRLAGQAAIRTTDRKVMVTLLGCARALRATGPGASGSSVEDKPVERMPPAVSFGEPAGAPLLSDREREVAELILTGLTYRQIGERLFISAKTVEHHVARMRQRLDVTSRDELFAQLRMCVGDAAL